MRTKKVYEQGGWPTEQSRPHITEREGRVGGIVSGPGPITKDQWRTKETSYKEALSRISLHGAVLVMPGRTTRSMDKDDARQLLVAAWRALKENKLSTKEYGAFANVIRYRMKRERSMGPVRFPWYCSHALRGVLKRQQHDPGNTKDQQTEGA